MTPAISGRRFNNGPVEVSPVMWKETRSIETASPADPRREGPKAANDEADRLRAKIAELTAASEQAARKAFEAGRQAGETAVKQAFDAEIRSVNDRLTQSLANLGSARAEAFRRAEADMVQLAVEIARRVLHRELSVDPNATEALVKAALEKLQAQEIHRVKVHPDQEAVVRKCLNDSGRGQALEVTADPSLQKGGVMFELSRGFLDASMETQLREIERGLSDELQVRR